MNNLLHKLDNLTHKVEGIAHIASETIQHTWDDLTTTPTPIITRQQIVFMEEQERARRVSGAVQSNEDRENAKAVSSLFNNLSFPYFKGNTSAGFKRVTNQLEESERRRRISAKSEATIRKLNANKMSSLIRSLGWPFYHSSSFQGPEYILVDETRLLEEEERNYRMNNPVWALSAKNNAALISNLMRWEWDNAKYFSLGMKRWTRGVEEKERSRRLADKLGMETAIILAYNLSSIIRNLGWPFFVQEKEKKVDITWELEEKERKWRLSHPQEQQIAREIAGQIGQIVSATGAPSIDVDKVEEEERFRRLEDFHEQYAAVAHAKQVSSLISKDTSRLIEEERQFRLQTSEVERKNARRVAHMISGLGMTLSGVKYLEEKERKRRVRDFEWQFVAKENAKKVSALLGSDFGSKWIDSLEENERTSRMWNRGQQLTAIKNARMVSRLILAGSNKKLASRALEEKERSRRMLDNSGQLVAMNNAKFIAGLVSPNNMFDSLSLEEAERSRRLSDNLSQEIAISNAKFIAGLVASNNTFDSLSLEEAERSRRLSDNSSQEIAKFNAHKISSMVPTYNTFDSLSLEEAERSRRLADSASEEIAKFNAGRISSLMSSRLPTESHSAPTLNRPLPAIPIEKSLPRAAPADFIAQPFFDESNVVAEPISARGFDAPIQSIPAPSAPVLEQAPIFAAPITAAPITAAPITAAPITAAPITAAPLSFAPISASPITAAPILSTAPIFSTAPTTTFVSTSAPILSAAPTTYTYGTPSSTSYLPASGLQMHTLSESDRKRMEKQAQKHSKRAAKESKRASNDIAKAAKMHNKGKDSRAIKYETRAEQHSVAAKHHQLWANDLTQDAFQSGNLYSTVGRPAM